MKGQDPGKVEADQTQYMTVAICNPTSGVNQGGRADFQDGSAAESAVNKLVFVFYDGAGNPTYKNIDYRIVAGSGVSFSLRIKKFTVYDRCSHHAYF